MPWRNHAGRLRKKCLEERQVSEMLRVMGNLKVGSWARQDALRLRWEVPEARRSQGETWREMKEPPV